MKRADDPAGMDPSPLRRVDPALVELLDRRLTEHEESTARRSETLRSEILAGRQAQRDWVDAKLDGLDKKLAVLVTAIDVLPERVAALERQRHDSAIESAARKDERRTVLEEMEVTASGRTIVPPNAPHPPHETGSDKLLASLATWSPVHWIAIVCLLVGGGTVARPVADRALDFILGVEPTQIEVVP